MYDSFQASFLSFFVGIVGATVILTVAGLSTPPEQPIKLIEDVIIVAIRKHLKDLLKEPR